MICDADVVLMLRRQSASDLREGGLRGASPDIVGLAGVQRGHQPLQLPAELRPHRVQLERRPLLPPWPRCRGGRLLGREQLPVLPYIFFLNKNSKAKQSPTLLSA